MDSFLTLALSLPNPATALLTILGIGLVIFVHEAGHFLCARACGVDVEVFSLGFGPRLVGFVRGGTDYRVSLVPIGGYVKMLGDQPGEGEGDPRALNSKTVGQRFLVYSGGVLMNIAFALVAFPILFSVGVPLTRPAVGAVLPGGAAWDAGLREGDEILEIDGRRILDYTGITLETALAHADEVEVVFSRDGVVQSVRVQPEYSPELGILDLGIGRPFKYEVDVVEDGPAARAGLCDGDVLIEIDGYPASARSMRRLDDPRRGEVEVVALRDGERVRVVLKPDVVVADDSKLLGIRAPENVIVGLRGRLAAHGSPLRVDDALVELDGRPITSVLDVEDACRELRASERDTAAAVVEREGRRVSLELTRDQALTLPDDAAFSAREDDGGRGFVPVVVRPGSAADRAGMRSGMRIVEVGGRAVRTWQQIRDAVAEWEGDQVPVVALDADDVRREFRVTPEPLRTPDYGMAFELDTVVHRYGPAEAFRVGMYASWNLARQAYLTLRKMISRQVSARNLGGPVAITTVSYHFAKSGIAKLFYFLALLSINLAVVNVLPIPILDGGHLLFLLIEKVKGSPVDDRVMGYSQVFGLMVILSLLVFVTYNDIARLFD